MLLQGYSDTRPGLGDAGSMSLPDAAAKFQQLAFVVGGGFLLYVLWRAVQK